MGGGIATSGYWTGGSNAEQQPTHNSFEPDLYTIVGTDESGNVALLYVVVTNS